MTNFRTFATAATALAAALALTGCVVAAPAAPTPTPTPEPLGTIYNIHELVDAFEAAGGQCDWNQTDRVVNASESGECSSNTVLMMFSDRTEREATVAALRSITLDDLSLLVGDNWIINSPSAAAVQDELGGELITN